MPVSPVTPALRVRTAIIARLADSNTGFNAYLASICGAQSIEAFTINFADDSQTFLEGKYEITSLIENEEVDLPLISIFQGPAQTDTIRDRVIASVFSGQIMFGLDLHMMSAEGQSQSQFDRLVSCAYDAIVNTFNDLTVGPQTWAAQRVLWNKNLAMGQPTRLVNQDTGLYLSTLPFSGAWTVVA